MKIVIYEKRVNDKIRWFAQRKWKWLTTSYLMYDFWRNCYVWSTFPSDDEKEAEFLSLENAMKTTEETLIEELEQKQENKRAKETPRKLQKFEFIFKDGKLIKDEL